MKLLKVMALDAAKWVGGFIVFLAVMLSVSFILVYIQGKVELATGIEDILGMFILVGIAVGLLCHWVGSAIKRSKAKH